MTNRLPEPYAQAVLDAVGPVRSEYDDAVIRLALRFLQPAHAAIALKDASLHYAEHARAIQSGLAKRHRNEVERLRSQAKTAASVVMALNAVAGRDLTRDAEIDDEHQP